MQRRDFLTGSLLGLAAGAGLTRLAAFLGDDPAPATPRARPKTAGPRPAPPGPVPRPARKLPPWVRSSVSEQGEDLVLMRIFKALKMPRPSYLDIGSHDPIRFNNTYKLYTNGSRGVLVEPNPFFCDKSKKARPGDKVLNIGIGITDQQAADYYIIRDRSLLNTFSKQQADRLVKISGPRAIEKVIKMPLVNINKVIAQHFKKAPDLISIDVEGLDLDIIKSLDFEKYRPAVFCVETLEFNTRQLKTEIHQLMHARGYEVRAGTWVNTIFVDGKLLQKK